MTNRSYNTDNLMVNREVKYPRGIMGWGDYYAAILYTTASNT